MMKQDIEPGALGTAHGAAGGAPAADRRPARRRARGGAGSAAHQSVGPSRPGTAPGAAGGSSAGGRAAAARLPAGPRPPPHEGLLPGAAARRHRRAPIGGYLWKDRSRLTTNSRTVLPGSSCRCWVAVSPRFSVHHSCGRATAAHVRHQRPVGSAGERQCPQTEAHCSARP